MIAREPLPWHNPVASKRVPTPFIHDVAWLQERHAWPGLKGVVVVENGYGFP
jgi:hypothetical protein